MNESVLIGKSERFLDQIKRREISLSDMESPEKFLSLYTYLKNNMDTLQDMRETMEIKAILRLTAPLTSTAVPSPVKPRPRICTMSAATPSISG